jgi:parallel beta-helix repeat protein
MFYGQKYLVENNYVHNYTLNKTDGGGIYIVSAARHFIPTRETNPVTYGRVLKNIVTEGIIDENSSAIYVDNKSQNFELSYNFVTGAKYGFHLHDSSLIEVKNNKIITEEGQMSGLYHSITSETSIRSEIENNLYVNTAHDIPSVYINIASLRVQTYKNNIYLYPYNKDLTKTMFRILSTYYTLSEWIADESRIEWTRTGEVENDISVFAGGRISI